MGAIDLDNLAVEIAKKHLLQNISFRELGRTYYASPSTIHRHLRKWLEEGRFDIRDKQAVRGNTVISRDDDLGEALVRKTGIWRARVVRIQGVNEAFTNDYLEKPDSEPAQRAYRASDELHRCLGEVTADLMLTSLRRNMTIGIASGRGVGFTVECFKEVVHRTPSWASGYEGIRVVSLCGGAHIGTWEYAHSRDFDADENVFSLSALLNIPRQNIFYMSSPISSGSPSPQSDIGHKINLDLALIGLGQLNTQHHYFRDYPDLQLKSMSAPIRRIIEWQSGNPDLRESIAEIVLKLYPAANKKLPEEFIETIRETNKNILAVSPETLRNANELILVAGGKQKVNALHGVLTGNYPDVPIVKRNLTLVTDSWTAEEILRRTEKR